VVYLAELSFPGREQKGGGRGARKGRAHKGARGTGTEGKARGDRGNKANAEARGDRRGTGKRGERGDKAHRGASGNTQVADEPEEPKDIHTLTTGVVQELLAQQRLPLAISSFLARGDI
jgi:hypothetical protein